MTIKNISTPQKRKKPEGLIIIATLVVLLASLTSIAGICYRDSIYKRDTAFLLSAFYGNDLYTLIVAIPLSIQVIYKCRREGTEKQYLVFLGLMDYMMYNFQFYLFGASFNSLFLLYCVIVALSTMSLICGVVQIISNSDGNVFSETPIETSHPWIAGYMMFTALSLLHVYISQFADFFMNGNLPQIITVTGHPTNIVFALDLTNVVPWMLLGGIGLMKKKNWGYSIAAIVNVKGAVYMGALATSTAMAMFEKNIEMEDGKSQLFLWTMLGLGSSISTFRLLSDK